MHTPISETDYFHQLLINQPPQPLLLSLTVSQLPHTDSENWSPEHYTDQNNYLIRHYNLEHNMTLTGLWCRKLANSWNWVALQSFSKRTPLNECLLGSHTCNDSANWHTVKSEHPEMSLTVTGPQCLGAVSSANDRASWFFCLNPNFTDCNMWRDELKLHSMLLW